MLVMLGLMGVRWVVKVVDLSSWCRWRVGHGATGMCDARLGQTPGMNLRVPTPPYPGTNSLNPVDYYFHSFDGCNLPVFPLGWTPATYQVENWTGYHSFGYGRIN